MESPDLPLFEEDDGVLVQPVQLLEVQRNLVKKSSSTAAVAAAAEKGPTVKQRILEPSGTTLQFGQQLLNVAVNISNYGRVPESVIAYGPDGSTFTFNTIFQTKPCENLIASDLAHLSSSDVAAIANMFRATPAPKPVCTSVFGVLVVVTGLSTNALYTGYSQDSYAKLLANILAEILDQNGDGVADDATLMMNMRSGPNGHWLFAMRTGLTNWNTWVDRLGTTVGVSEAHDWQTGMSVNMVKRNCAEEVFHTYQHAREKTYPAAFGLLDIPASCLAQPSSCNWAQSIASSCSAKAQCNWYRHPECSCSLQGAGASATHITAGDCATPSCAGIEWEFNVAMAYQNNYEGSHGLDGSQWKNRSSIVAKLTSSGAECQAYLSVLQDAKYFVPTKPFTFNYVR